MKRIVFTTFFLLFTLALYAQEKALRHEVKLSNGILNLPNGFKEDLFLGGLTANYMYCISKWFSVGINANWQFPSDLEHYSWREYSTDGSFKDVELAERHNFFAVAPELRFSAPGATERILFYSSISAGYGVSTGIAWKNFYNVYWYWNVTIFGANVNLGRTQRFFVGGAFGVGFKGLYSVHGGYRF
jgi:hypothetical protein